MRSAITLGFVLAVSAPSLSIAAVSGEAVYKERCAPCHDSGSSRVPARDELKKLPVGRIIRAMDFGLMSNVASKLRQDEREAVAAYLGVPGNNSQPPASAYCTDRSVKLTNGA